jgi:hypothetical protein
MYRLPIAMDRVEIGICHAILLPREDIAEGTAPLPSRTHGETRLTHRFHAD